MENFKGTKGKWHWVEYTSNELPELQNEYNQKICGFGNNYDYYPTEGTPPNKYDALLIQKSPELLKMLGKVLIEVDWTYKHGDILQDLVLKLYKETTEINY